MNEKINYELIDKSVFFPREKILVIADLHLGFEESLNERGIFVPRVMFKEIMANLEKIFAALGNRKLDETIILGDLKHEFSGFGRQEAEEIRKLISFLRNKSKKIVLIRGNHDNYLANIINKEGIKIKDFYIKNNICFVHGHKVFSECFNKKVKIIVMGHIHPSISLREGAKKEKYKCFLVGKFRGKEVIILPSFFSLVEGSDIPAENANSAFRLNLHEFDVHAVGGDRTYNLGKLAGLEKYSR